MVKQGGDYFKSCFPKYFMIKHCHKSENLHFCKIYIHSRKAINSNNPTKGGRLFEGVINQGAASYLQSD